MYGFYEGNVFHLFFSCLKITMDGGKMLFLFLSSFFPPSPHGGSTSFRIHVFLNTEKCSRCLTFEISRMYILAHLAFKKQLSFPSLSVVM